MATKVKSPEWIYQGNRWSLKRYFPHQLRYMDGLCKAIEGGHAPPLPPQLVSLDLDISAILLDFAITTDYGSWTREISKALVINCDSPLISAL